MELDTEALTPDEDGINHINAASESKPKLGKALSNFGHFQ